MLFPDVQALCTYKLTFLYFHMSHKLWDMDQLPRAQQSTTKTTYRTKAISSMMKAWESWGWPRWSPEVPPSLNYSGLLWSCHSLCFFIEIDWERYFDTSFIKIMDSLFLQWSGKQEIKWQKRGKNQKNQIKPYLMRQSTAQKLKLISQLKWVQVLLLL